MPMSASSIWNNRIEEGVQIRAKLETDVASIDDDVIDAAFDTAVEAFLDSLEESGVFDTLSDETIKAKFAQILAE